MYPGGIYVYINDYKHFWPRLFWDNIELSQGPKSKRYSTVKQFIRCLPAAWF